MVISLGICSTGLEMTKKDFWNDTKAKMLNILKASLASPFHSFKRQSLFPSAIKLSFNRKPDSGLCMLPWYLLHVKVDSVFTYVWGIHRRTHDVCLWMYVHPSTHLVTFFLFSCFRVNTWTLICFGMSSGLCLNQDFPAIALFSLKYVRSPHVCESTEEMPIKNKLQERAARPCKMLPGDSIVNQFINLNFGKQFLVKDTKDLNACSTATLAPVTTGEHWVSREGCIRFNIYSWYDSWNLYHSWVLWDIIQKHIIGTTISKVDIKGVQKWDKMQQEFKMSTYRQEKGSL